jgi:hypothetical protein
MNLNSICCIWPHSKFIISTLKMFNKFFVNLRLLIISENNAFLFIVVCVTRSARYLVNSEGVTIDPCCTPLPMAPVWVPVQFAMYI